MRLSLHNQSFSRPAFFIPIRGYELPAIDPWLSLRIVFYPNKGL